MGGGCYSGTAGEAPATLSLPTPMPHAPGHMSGENHPWGTAMPAPPIRAAPAVCQMWKREGEGAQLEERLTVPAALSIAELVASSSQRGTQHHPERLWDPLPAPSPPAPLGNASSTGPEKYIHILNPTTMDSVLFG